MSNFTGITNAASRRAKRDEFVAANPSEDRAARYNKAQLAMANQIKKLIKMWANAQADARGKGKINKNSFRFNAAFVPTEDLDAWETELTAAGYTITRTGGKFTITMPE